MFKKVLVANRGEIAVRIVRTCRDLGIETVAVYEPADRGALHMRLATECVPLDGPKGYFDGDRILAVARETGADAVHPGYGYFAENAGFIRACEEASVRFVGPSSAFVAALEDKIQAMQRVRRAGISTPEHSSRSYDVEDLDEMKADAARLGFPLVVKSTSGGRGRGMRLVTSPDGLAEAALLAGSEAQIVYGSRRVYLEKAIPRARQLAVQVVGDDMGGLVHLGEREGSVTRGNQKLIEEAPSPWLSEATRARLLSAALEIARLFGVRGAATVEFLADESGAFHFTEVKPRIPREHPLTEMVAGIDLVRLQLRVAAGEALGFAQADVRLEGWAQMCHVNAEDPWRSFLPTPGRVERVRLPGGPNVRVDTYVFPGAEVPAEYDPAVAKLTVWGEARDEAVRRLSRALEELTLIGPPTNVPLLLRIVRDPDFVRGVYDTGFFHKAHLEGFGDERHLRDLAIIAALSYAERNLAFRPSRSERLESGWIRDARRLPAV